MNRTRFAKEYMDLYYYWQRLQWENYAFAAGHDLNAVDERFYRLLTQNRNHSWFSAREAEVFQLIRDRTLVEKHPEVARLRNRLDNPELYGTGRQQQAAAMEPEVLELMRLRQQLARRLGYRSYPHLVFASEELDERQVRQEVTCYVEANLPRAKQLATEHGLTWPGWFAGLDRLDREYKCNLQQNVLKLMGMLGLQGMPRGLKLHVADQPIHGAAFALSPREVAVLVRPVNSLRMLAVLCHEIGHALGYLGNRQTGLLRLWTTIHDETNAMVVEQLALAALLEPGRIQLVEEIRLLENVRCGLSFLLELDIWQQPDRARELYSAYYSRLAVDVGNPVLWALDSFRSIDPVYVHNYVLAAVWARQLVEKLEHALGRDYPAWGKWLRDNLLAPGRALPLKQKLDRGPVVPAGKDL